MTVKAKIACAT